MAPRTNRRTLLALSSLALAGLAGCLSDGDDGPDDGSDDDGTDDDSSERDDPAEPRVLSADVERVEPDVSGADLEALVTGNNAFALDLLHELAGDGENLFFSPFSVSLALAMTWAGARGSTEAAMADALAFPHEQETLHPAFNRLGRDVEASAEGGGEDEDGAAEGEAEDAAFTLEIANSVWGQEDYQFHEDFLETLARHYGAGLRTLDFESEPEPAREAINGWVAEETEETIEELLPEGSIHQDVRLVLTNAIYFYANWRHQFDEADTEDGTFTALSGGESEVPMMHQHLRTNYAAVDGRQVLELPYVGDATMVLVLPAEGEFEAFRDDLDADRLAALFEATGDASGEVALPRFEFESSIELEEPLTELGMGEAFSERANFEGMTDEERLTIDDVYHDAFVSVDEDGTEAGAATGAVMVPTSAPAESFEVVVDRPFLFAIRHDPTDSVLFLGQVVDAAAE